MQPRPRRILKQERIKGPRWLDFFPLMQVKCGLTHGEFMRTPIGSILTEFWRENRRERKQRELRKETEWMGLMSALKRKKQ